MGEQTQSNHEYKSGHEAIKIQQLSCEDASALNRPADSLFQRIDRLDSVLSSMEDKAPTEPRSSPSTSPHSTRRHSSAPATPSGLERRRKPTESVLEEVHEKGTLVERVSDLEKRVMTLQRMLSAKLSENVVNPSALRLTTPHRRAMSHYGYDQQLLQDPIDLEKHEVTLSQSARVEHDRHPEPLVYSKSDDIDITRPERPHVEHYEETVSSAKASVEAVEQDPSVLQQQSKKKKLRIRKWLSKRLNFHFPGTSQEKHTWSTGRCWGPKIHPKNCWNVKKRDSSPYSQYGHMSIDDE